MCNLNHLFMRFFCWMGKRAERTSGSVPDRLTVVGVGVTDSVRVQSASLLQDLLQIDLLEVIESQKLVCEDRGREGWCYLLLRVEPILETARAKHRLARRRLSILYATSVPHEKDGWPTVTIVHQGHRRAPTSRVLVLDVLLQPLNRLHIKPRVRAAVRCDRRGDRSRVLGRLDKHISRIRYY